MKRYINVLWVLLTCIACNEADPPLREVEENVPATHVEDISVLAVPEVPCLTHYFKQEIVDEGFESFYFELIKALRSKDTIAMLNAFADEMGFAQYGCWDGEIIQNPSCDPCAKCSKIGVIRGNFGLRPLAEVCEILEKKITCFGIGPLQDQHWFTQNVKESGPNYTNMNFENKELGKKLYGYEAILVFEDSTPVFAEPSGKSEIIAYLHAEPILRSLDVGEDRWNDEEQRGFFPHYVNNRECYVPSANTLNGFSYTKVIFGKVNGEWKITYLIEPPGC